MKGTAMTITEPNLTTLPPEKPKRRWVWPVVATVALFAGIAIGGAGDPPAAEPEVRTETVEVEVPGPTVTETVEVEVTPPVCIEAIDYAYEGFTIAADVLTAASQFDIAGMEAGTAQLEALAPDWQVAATACQAS
jgi:hypothetical protein